MYAPQTNPDAALQRGPRLPGPIGSHGPGAPQNPNAPAQTPGPKGVNDAAAVQNGDKAAAPVCAKQDAVTFPRPQALLDIRAHEGYTNYMYLDSLSLITIGVGWNLMSGGDSVAPPQSVVDLPWLERSTSKPPADKAKSVQAAWTALRKISSYRTPQAHAAGYFENKTDLYIDDSQPDNVLAARFAKHIADFTGNLHHIFKDFDSFPVPAREALLDLVMMGEGRDARAALKADPKHHIKGHSARKGTGLRQYTTLRTAAEAHDWKKASENCRRKQVNASRNNWTRDKFVEAIGWECAKTT